MSIIFFWKWRGMGQCSRLNNIFITAGIWNSWIERRKKNAFSICNKNYPCSYLLGHKLEIFGHFLLCHFVWADGNCLWYRWKHCKSWSNYIHIQSNLLIFNLMGLKYINYTFIIHLLHNVFGLEMIKMLNFSYACMCTQKDDIFV